MTDGRSVEKSVGRTDILTEVYFCACVSTEFPCVSKIRHTMALYVIFDTQIIQFVCLRNKSH